MLTLMDMLARDLPACQQSANIHPVFSKDTEENDISEGISSVQDRTRVRQWPRVRALVTLSLSLSLSFLTLFWLNQNTFPNVQPSQLQPTNI